MAGAVNRQWRLVSRPVGEFRPSDLALQEEPVPEPGPGEFLVRHIYLSVGPSYRVSAATYFAGRMPGVVEHPLGAVMTGAGVGEVVASHHPDFAVGDLVRGPIGWQDYVISDGAQRAPMEHVRHEAPLVQSAGVLWHTGLTAYFGLLDVGRPQAGETVLVSGAAGAVGSIAGQLAKIHGCRVVGIAGSEAKCAWLVNDLGFDGAINYRTEDIGQRLTEICPSGVDIYFDNVMGPLLDDVIVHLAQRGRVVLCGGMANYTSAEPAPGPENLMLLVWKQARVEGFNVFSYAAKWTEAETELRRWLAEGALISKETIVSGLEQAPAALNAMFAGGHSGKLLVQVSEEPASSLVS